MNTRIRKIVIVGGGTAGWMTAAALSKVLQPQQCETSLVESEALGTVGVGEATIPPIVEFNAFIGLEEREFMRTTQATFKLGIEFVDWLRLGHRYVHPFGEFGIDVGAVPFHHHWQRARKLGDVPPLQDFSLETLSALAGKFTRKTGINHPLLSKMAYAYHLDAGLYGRTLRELAERRGVKRVEGQVKEVLRNGESGFIKALCLDSGQRIDGDFFVDCSGFRGLLIEETLQTGFEDWSRFLPCDRAWAVQCSNAGALSPYTRSTARVAGWQWRIPLQHRVGNGHVFSSAFMNEDEAREVLMDNLEAPPTTEPRLLKFRAGRRKKLWNLNCVAIGLSGGFLEPLESTSIHLIQMGIYRLLGFFPTLGIDARKQERYNEDLRSNMERVRDFLILHYHATERDSEFWRFCRHVNIPDWLRQKVDLYSSSGIIVREEHDLFKEASWLAVLEGQGIHAMDYLPLADTMSEQDLRTFMRHTRSVLARAVEAMPSCESFIQRYCATAA